MTGTITRSYLHFLLLKSPFAAHCLVKYLWNQCVEGFASTNQPPELYLLMFQKVIFHITVAQSFYVRETKEIESVS